MYQVDGGGLWSSVFAVPSEVVDRHIRLCGALSLKVLLILLRHGRPFSPEELATLLNQSVPDIQDAVNYWIDAGVIARGDVAAEPTPAPTEQEVEAASPLPQAAPEQQGKPKERESSGGGKVIKIGRSRTRLGVREINEMAVGDPGVGSLIREAQVALGRTLKPLESETISTLYCYDGLSPDIILMLLQYCISIDKASMGYLEKIAIDWIDRGIDTHEKAEAELLRLTEISEMEKELRSLFGIYNRKLTDKEIGYYTSWQKEMRFSIPMIQLAYERTVDSKGTFSFAYINGILKKWHDKGISTQEQALKETKSGARAGREEPAASYDLEQFNQILKQGNIFD